MTSLPTSTSTTTPSASAPSTSDTSTSTTSTSSTTSSTSTSTTTSSTTSSTSTTSTSTSSTSTTSTTSSSSSSSTSSTTSTSSSPSTTLLTTSSLQTLTTQTTDANGQPSTVVVTNTVPAVVSETPTASSSAGASHTNESFFQNKGAVAGTFAAVGVVVAIIVLILITRTVRARRQKRFDREMDEAAREAAGTEVPAFLDDDDEPKPYGATAYGGHGGYGHAGYNQGDWTSSGGAGMYSDTASHGTYAQPPLSHESYPMHDFGNSSSSGGVGPGGIFEHGSAGAGAFAAGAAAAGLTGAASHDGSRSGAPSSNTAVGDSPYPAFLHPGGYESGPGVGLGGYPNMGRGQQQGYGNGGFDNDVVAGGAAGMAGIGRRSSMNAATVNRMKSQSSTGALSGPSAPSVPEEGYPSHYPPAGAPGNSQPDLLNRSTNGGSGPQGQGQGNGFAAGGASFSNAVHDAAFGASGQPSPGLPNPFTSKMESDEDGDAAEDPYGGYGSEGEEEEEHRPKVLKVANE